METLLGRHWHHLAVDDVAHLLDTDLNKGLSPLEVKRRQAHFGPNQMTMGRRRSRLVLLLLQFHQPLVYILLLSGAVTVVLKGWVDSSVIFGVVLANALIGFIQESRAENAIESLKKMVVTEATVIREGKKGRIPSSELVPGDLVFVQSGDKVPADLRLVRIRDLQTEESALTGESLPVEKREGILSSDTTLPDRTNMAYAGTLVTYGQSHGIVVATGDKTETGRISRLISEVGDLSTPLTRKIEGFSKVLLIAILGLAGVTFVVGVVRGLPAVDMFMASVALAVAAIPEGLPAVVTITLAVGVRRMAARNVIVRSLPAVETLGSTTVICSDKTGTLTENQMTVQQIVAGGQAYEMTGIGYEPVGALLLDGNTVNLSSSLALAECLTAGILCNDSQMKKVEGRWTIQGDPTEGALIVAARKLGIFEEEAGRRFPRLDTLPFESHHQYMATLHATGTEPHRILYLKGSVEKVVERCTEAIDAGGDAIPLDAEEVLRVAGGMAEGGLRVLAFARRSIPLRENRVTHEDVTGGLTFLGLQGMIDPPRSEAIVAVRACRSAGVDVKMITGDHALTAAAIAQRLGLGCPLRSEKGECFTVTGTELSQLPDQELMNVVERSSVFARVAPDQKLRLVEALQAAGHVVAMTGDGVNDAPALRKADIGIAMGITGTDVSKEAADMILTDDNFASIEKAVEEGRGVFDNLIKFIMWILPASGGQGLIVMASIVAGVTLPILPVQILWLNMTTALFMGLMLAFEPKEGGIMARPPRRQDSPILTFGLLVQILLLSAVTMVGAFGLFIWQQRNGADVAQARTIAVNAVVMIQMLYLFHCRTFRGSVFKTGFFSNRWVLMGCGLMIAAQMFFTYGPFMNEIFHSAPISPVDWLETLAVALIGFGIISAEKRLRAWYEGETTLS